MIPFLDLQKVNARFESQFQEEFQTFLNSGHYILGDSVAMFEKQFAAFCGTDYCLGISNGLDALTLIFRGYIELGKLKPNDEVIVPANTFIASILALLNTGLKPVFVEPDVNTLNISPSLIEKAITNKTRAILAVHLYGQLANMNAINSIARKHKLLVVEDAAQAHGAENEDSQKAGGLSHAAAFSFYPTKNLGALGDAGAITTNDRDLYELIMRLRNYGFKERYVCETNGVNNRMDEIQARFLSVKLKFLDSDNERRRVIAKKYLNEISNPKIIPPYYNNSLDHVFHLFVIQVEDRVHFMNYLKKNEIQTIIHYPVPPHRQKVLNNFKNLSLPVTEKLHKNILSLPLNPVLTDDEVSYIINKINAY